MGSYVAGPEPAGMWCIRPLVPFCRLFFVPFPSDEIDADGCRLSGGGLRHLGSYER